MSLSIALVTCWALAGAAQLGPDLETARAVSTAPAASAPAATSAPAVASPPRRRPLELEGCQQLLLDADYLAAQACYRGLARTESDPARIRAAAGLAELAAEMAPASASAPAETRPSAQVKPVKSSSGDAAVDYIAAGKAELVLASGVYGLWMGGLALATTWILLASAMPGSDLAWLFFTGMLMLPVAGGAAGLLGSGIATVAVPELSAGDTALMRMAMLAGPLNAISSLFLLSGLGISLGGTGSSSQPQMIPLWMLGVSGAPVVAAAAASALVDLPDGGPALATSAAIWGSAIALLGLGAAQLPGEQWPLAIGLIGVGADALALSALAVSPLLSVTRPDTWALDLGAALGLGVGAALAFGLGAPNPMLGYGAMAAGTLLGGSAGFAAGFMGRRLLEGLELPELPGLPDVVAVAPLIAPGDARGTGHPLIGMTLAFSL